MKRGILSFLISIAIVGAVCTLKTDFPDGTCTGTGNPCTFEISPGVTADLYTAINCPSDSRALKP